MIDDQLSKGDKDGLDVSKLPCYIPAISGDSYTNRVLIVKSRSNIMDAII